MGFIDFFVNTSNLIWVDLAALFILLFLAFIVFIFGQNYFHYLFSINFIVIGFFLLFWPLLDAKILADYDSFLANPELQEWNNFSIFLKINPLLRQIVIFTFIFLATSFLASIVYLLIIKRIFITHSGPSRIVGAVVKLLFIGLVFFGTTYLFTPFYLILHKQHSSTAPAKTYLRTFFEKTGLHKLTTKGTNPFLPIWDDLRQLKKTDVSIEKFFESLETVDQFLKREFPYIHKNYWSSRVVGTDPQYTIGELIKSPKLLTDPKINIKILEDKAMHEKLKELLKNKDRKAKDEIENKLARITLDFKDWFNEQWKSGVFIFIKDRL